MSPAEFFNVQEKDIADLVSMFDPLGAPVIVIVAGRVENDPTAVWLVVPSVSVPLRYHSMVEPLGNVFAGTDLLSVDPLMLIVFHDDVPDLRQ